MKCKTGSGKGELLGTVDQASLQRLSIIGAGRVGKTFGRLLKNSGRFEIREVLNRSFASSREAVNVIGAGAPVEHFTELGPTDVLLLAVNDDALESVVNEVARCCHFPGAPLALHCSGAHPSAVLEPLRERSLKIGSIHPIKSFADPFEAERSFAGTWCTIEGELDALPRLQDLVEAVNGIPLAINPEKKLLYHAAFAFSCAYLTVLFDSAVTLLVESGISPRQAQEIIESLTGDTFRNIARLGPRRALTGPIARGDISIVMRHLHTLKVTNPNLADAYRALGVLSSKLAEREKMSSPAAQNTVRKVLNEP